MIIVAALLSILFKKDTDVSDFEDVAGTGLVQPDKDMKPANEGIPQTPEFKQKCLQIIRLSFAKLCYLSFCIFFQSVAKIPENTFIVLDLIISKPLINKRII